MISRSGFARISQAQRWEFEDVRASNSEKQPIDELTFDSRLSTIIPSPIVECLL